MSPQAKRDPMLLFEFDAALFQLEYREPEFDPLFQLPPRMTAYLPRLPQLLSPFHPCAYHCPNVRQQNLRCQLLMWRKYMDGKEKSHPET